jgi:hypothetical protein
LDGLIIATLTFDEALIRNANIYTDGTGEYFVAIIPWAFGFGYLGFGSGSDEERAELRVLAEFGKGGFCLEPDGECGGVFCLGSGLPEGFDGAFTVVPQGSSGGQAA